MKAGRSRTTASSALLNPRFVSVTGVLLPFSYIGTNSLRMLSPESKSEDHTVSQDAMPREPLSPTSQDDTIEGQSTAPKKQAVVVYEGEEGWQRPKVVHEHQHSDYGQDDDTASGEDDDTPESRDLLAEYPDDTEVSADLAPPLITLALSHLTCS